MFQAADTVTPNPAKRVRVDSNVIADLLLERAHGDTMVSGFKVD